MTLGSPECVVTLGWRMDENRNPAYWLSSNPLPGHQAASDMISVRVKDLAAHTACIAQSGSGKSFFLGRLVEEIACNTRSRCVILDPNGDFLRVGEVAEPGLWESAKYDREERKGKLPHEASQEAFAAQWGTITSRVFSAWTSAESITRTEYYDVWWPSVSAEFIAETGDPIADLEIRHCHAVVAAICELVFLRHSITSDDVDPLTLAERVLMLDSGGFDVVAAQAAIEDEFGSDNLATEAELNSYLAAEAEAAKGMLESTGGLSLESSDVRERLTEHLRSGAARRIESLRDGHVADALRSLRFVSGRAVSYYFGKLCAYLSNGLGARRGPGETAAGARIAVYELLSWHDRSTWLLTASSVIESEWRAAKTRWLEAVQRPANEDDRVPTFIVVDEAHRLMQADPETRQELAVRDQFRTIAAEGRKYGIFLILVSQRPDKLDPFVLGECDNVALMRIGNRAVLKQANNSLQLDAYSEDELQQCLEFGVGRVLLVGKWAPEGKMLFSAARRTVECGRNLRTEAWANPISS